MTTQAADPLERAVLGAMLLDQAAAVAVSGIVQPADWSYRSHQLIHEAIEGLLGGGQPVDEITVPDALRASGQLEQVGGVSYLMSLIDTLPDVANVEYYARRVHEEGARRRLRKAVLQVMSDLDSDRPLADVVDDLQEATVTLDDADDGPASAGEVMARVAARSVALANGELALDVISTGLPTLDERLVGGLRRGRMYILAAGTSQGKSTLAGQLAITAAQAGRVVLYHSLEADADDLGTRWLAGASGASSIGLSLGRLQPYMQQRIMETAAAHASLPLVIDDRGGIRPAQIRAAARAVQMGHGRLDLVVVDYLQLVDAPGETEYAQVSYVSRQLQTLSRQLGVCVLALSQFNRDAARSGNELHKLRGSGSIEQDGDTILFLRSKEEDRPLAQLEIRKQRNGPTCVGQHAIRLRLDGDHYRFRELRPGDEAGDPEPDLEPSPESVQRQIADELASREAQRGVWPRRDQ